MKPNTNYVQPKTTLHKRNKKALHKHSIFSVIFTSALGGGSIGAAFGVPGVFVGAAVGGVTGAIIGRIND
jgi:uncharacterized membrane protein